MGRGRLSIPTEARAAFLTKEEGGCTVWMGTKGQNSHARIRETQGNRVISARRALYEARNGPVSDDLIVTSTCGNPRCVAPEHAVAAPIGQYDPKRVLRGERCGMAKLTPEEVLQIRRCGGTLKETAERFGVSMTQIGNIRSRRSWAHL